MAAPFSHKLLSISSVVKKCAPAKGPTASVSNYCCASFRAPAQNHQNPETLVGLLCVSKITSNIYPRHSYDRTQRAGFCSWLRSSRVIFIKGTKDPGGGGDNSDNGFPNKSRSRSSRDLGETSIFRQEGHNIEEVPVAVIRSNSSEKPIRGNGPPRSYVDLSPSDEAAFVDGFSNYNSPQQVLKMLDTIPSQEVTPFVSFSILKKLFELENNFGFRNQGRSWLNASENSTSETFVRLAIVTRLVDTILTSDDTSLVLDTLDLLRRECPGEHPYDVYDLHNHMDYRNKLLQEVLTRVTEGKLELEQVCRAVVILGKMESDKGVTLSGDYIDKFWVGILDRSDDINSENIVEVLRTVKYFRKSSRLVMNLLERKMMTLWWKTSTETVAEICSVFTSDETPLVSIGERTSHSINSWQVSNRFLMSLSKCINLNVHKVTENELARIVKAFHTLHFCDTPIEQAINKYMKAKCVKISDPQLVSNIMDYSRKFRLRFPNVLDAAAEFVVKHNATNLSPPQLASILRPFGELDYQPEMQGSKFWEIVELYLMEKFIQFPPKDIVAVLLSCVYLMKYPINFVDKTFSPYFLDRLHTSEPDFLHLQHHRSNLKLLDPAMTVECRNKYSGPLLPKDFSARTMFIDGRILRVTTLLKETLLGMFKNCSIETSVVLPSLPLNPVFTADVLLTTPRIESETERHNVLRNHISSYFLYTSPPPSMKHVDLTIFLVNIPEHYSSDGKHLIGIQSMRKRLLKALGFKVVSLRHQTLMEAKGDFVSLTEYIEKKLLDAGVLR